LHTYYFETDNPLPFIIDAGAQIGMSTLYFKKQYPGAEIVAIEPNTINFKLLEENIWENQLDNVTTIQAALTGYGSETSFIPMKNNHG
jgi:FkbM family methyltransferase